MLMQASKQATDGETGVIRQQGIQVFKGCSSAVRQRSQITQRKMHTPARIKQRTCALCTHSSSSLHVWNNVIAACVRDVCQSCKDNKARQSFLHAQPCFAKFCRMQLIVKQSDYQHQGRIIKTKSWTPLLLNKELDPTAIVVRSSACRSERQPFISVS